MEPLYQELELVSWSSRLNSYSQLLDDAFNNFYNHFLGIRPNYTTWKMPLQELSATKSPFPMKERDRPLCRILLHWMMGESIILQLWISPGTKKCDLLSPLRMLIHRHNSWSDWLICSTRSWKQKETNQRHRRIWWCCMGSMLVNHIRVRPPSARNRPLGEINRNSEMLRAETLKCQWFSPRRWSVTSEPPKVSFLTARKV